MNNTNELIQSLCNMNQQLNDININILVKEDLILAIRRLTCREKDPPLQLIIESNVIITMVKLIESETISEEAIHNILWIFSNICSGTNDQTNYIIQNFGLIIMIKYCSHQNTDIVVQALWGIGNIAGDSIKRRDQILETGCAKILCDILDRKENQLNKQHLRTLSWVLSNLVRGTPKVDFASVELMIPYFVRLLEQTDQEILVDTVWGLSYLSDNNASHEKLINLNLAGCIKNILLSNKNMINILTPCIRVLGNLASGESIGIDHLIENDCIVLLIQLAMQEHKTTIKREVAWALSNVAAGSDQQRLYLINHIEFHKYMNQIFGDKSLNLSVMKEFFFIMGNLCEGGHPFQQIIIENQWHIRWIQQFEELNIYMNQEFQKMTNVFFEGIFSMVKENLQVIQDCSKLIENIYLKIVKVGIQLSSFANKVLQSIGIIIHFDEDKMEQELEISDLTDQEEQDEEEEEVVMINEIEKLQLESQAGAGPIDMIED